VSNDVLHLGLPLDCVSERAEKPSGSYRRVVTALQLRHRKEASHSASFDGFFRFASSRVVPLHVEQVTIVGMRFEPASSIISASAFRAYFVRVMRRGMARESA
jgi:hypothetical protein